MRNILLNAVKLEKLSQTSIEEKGMIIKELLNKHALSYRQIAAETGIPTTTLHHWVNGRKTEQTITNKHDWVVLHQKIERSTKKEDVMDVTLKQAQINLRKYILHPKDTIKTTGLIKELINTLNRILIRIEK